MGLEDRDWYREKPSEAWRDYWSGTSRRSHPAGGWEADPPCSDTSILRAHIRPGAALAMIVSAVAIGLTWQLDFLHLRAPDPAARVVLPARAPSAQTSTEILLRPTPALVHRADVETTWTVTDPRFGSISVVVRPGETALGVLARELSARGYRVTLPATTLRLPALELHEGGAVS